MTITTKFRKKRHDFFVTIFGRQGGAEQKGGAFDRMKGDDPNWCLGLGERGILQDTNDRYTYIYILIKGSLVEKLPICEVLKTGRVIQSSHSSVE